MQDAGKLVFRYNTVYNGFVLMHNTCWNASTSTTGTGGLATDVYNNEFIFENNYNQYAFFEYFGGTHLFHNNTLKFYGNAHFEAEDCAGGSTTCPGGWQDSRTLSNECVAAGWMNCDGANNAWTTASTNTKWITCVWGDSGCTKRHCSNSWDLCTVDGDCSGGTCTGYLDNVDAATGRVCFNGTGAGMLDDSTGKVLSDPMYFWSNTAYYCTAGGDCTGASTKSVQISATNISDNSIKDTDFFNNTAKPGYASYEYPHPLRGEADPDESPPIRSALFPLTEQECDAETPVDIQIGLTTDEPGTCKYNTTDAAYADMTGTFDGAGTTTHTKTLSLNCNATHTYYVRCQDDEITPNVNTTSSVISFNINPAAADTDPPGFSSAALGTDGRTLTVTFDEAIKFGAGGSSGVTIAPSGGTSTVAYQSGEYTTGLVFYASRIIYSTETLTVSYTQPTNGFEDGAGNDLATFTTQAVTNNSTQVAPTPIGDAVGIWSDDVTVGSRFGDGTRPFERGVRFTTLVPVKIHGIQFYKDAANTGTHTGNLWRTDRSLYTTVTFTGESASGWQTQLFPTPIVLDSGVSFIASVFMPAGYCNLTTGYFTSAGVSNGLITFPVSSAGSGNGVYKYTSVSSFPDAESGSNGNYWIDVLSEAYTFPPGKVQSGSGAGAGAGTGGGMGLQ